MNFIRIFIALAAVALTGCASTRPLNPVDPFESFNRGVYTFNDTLDKAVVKPVAQGYNKVMPETGKSMVINFFSNLDDVIVTANDLLQFKFVQAFSDGMRVLVNSTVGVAGLVDVASMNLEKHNEDFGQTLGYWGVKNGPYLVVPILGPSTIRDSVGDIGDSQVSLISNTKHVRTRNQLYLTKGIKRRAQLLENESLLDGAVLDRYAFIRDAYLQRRESLVYDGNPPQEPSEDESLDNEPTAPTEPSPAAP
ncbi:MAG: VacJ family lipoprotein [Gallionella sp.]|nr:VacJ family lipoprotein [Gallionella sp.]